LAHVGLFGGDEQSSWDINDIFIRVQSIGGYKSFIIESIFKPEQSECDFFYSDSFLLVIVKVGLFGRSRLYDFVVFAGFVDLFEPSKFESDGDMGFDWRMVHLFIDMKVLMINIPVYTDIYKSTVFII